MADEISRRTVLTGVTAAVAATAVLSTTSTATANYSLQEAVEGLAVPAAITVIGCGGFGCWPAFFSALAGVGELLLIDAGDVDEVDMARTPYRASDVGRPKAEALRDIILMFRPDAKITAQKRFIEPTDEDIYVGDVMFDGTNYRPLSEALPAASKAHGMKFVHGFYNGNLIGVSDRFHEQINYIPGNKIPVWVGSAGMSGLLAMFSAYVNPFTFLGRPEQLAMNDTQLNEAFSAACAIRLSGEATPAATCDLDK